MNTVFKEHPSRSPRFLFGFSPWLLIGVSVILGLAVLVLAVRSSRREGEFLGRNLSDRAEALIWALEAGTRTWMGNQGDRRLLQQLVQETAKQPGIVYIAVAHTDGEIVSHSDPQRVGEAFPVDLPREWDKNEDGAARVRRVDDREVFEVRRLFAPIQGNHHAYSQYQRGGHHGMGMGMGGRRRGRDLSETAEAPAAAPQKTFVFVGLDNAPVAQALDRDVYNNIVSALIVAGLGLAGFVSMFWAHGYRRSRRMLMDARALAQEVITSLPLGLLTRDPEGDVGMANAVALDMLGRRQEEVAGKPLADVPGLDWNAVLAGLDDGRRSLECEAVLHRDGGDLPVNVAVSRVVTEDGLSLGHLFILHDVGEVRRLQAEVEKNRRLTALGNLAAGVAHEIRNPLSSIKGLATYLAGRAAAGGPEEAAARTMIGESDRLNRVVSELLEFARPGTIALTPADINAVASGALRLAGADIAAKDITVEFLPDPAAPPVPVNKERLTQALLNLYLNAIQAMDRGGILRIALTARANGAEAAVTVGDNGHGMTEEVRASMFTPYFTTKAGGTGLGLAIVHQIVEAHGGGVEVASESGRGSEFTIVLPVAERKSI